MDFDRSEYIADLLSKLDAIKEECSSLTLDTTDEVAFSYLIADMFETLDEGQFVYTDGPNDLGIDFYTHSDGSLTFINANPSIMRLILKAKHLARIQ